MIDGLPADLVALALPLDVEKIVDAGLIRQDWTKAYPNNSVGGVDSAPLMCVIRVAIPGAERPCPPFPPQRPAAHHACCTISS